MLDLELLPRALHWLRIREGKKQCEVAEEAGVSASMLSGYEKGSRTPSLESLAKVLHALGSSFSELEAVLLSFGEAGRGPGPESAAAPTGRTEEPYPLPGERMRRSSLAEPGARPLGAGAEAPSDEPPPGETLERELDREAVELLRSIKRWLQAERGDE